MAEQEKDVFVDTVQEKAVFEVNNGGVAEEEVVPVFNEVFQAGFEDVLEI